MDERRLGRKGKWNPAKLEEHYRNSSGDEIANVNFS